MDFEDFQREYFEKKAKNSSSTTSSCSGDACSRAFHGPTTGREYADWWAEQLAEHEDDDYSNLWLPTNRSYYGRE